MLVWPLDPLHGEEVVKDQFNQSTPASVRVVVFAEKLLDLIILRRVHQHDMDEKIPSCPPLLLALESLSSLSDADRPAAMQGIAPVQGECLIDSLRERY